MGPLRRLDAWAVGATDGALMHAQKYWGLNLCILIFCVYALSASLMLEVGARASLWVLVMAAGFLLFGFAVWRGMMLEGADYRRNPARAASLNARASLNRSAPARPVAAIMYIVGGAMSLAPPMDLSLACVALLFFVFHYVTCASFHSGVEQTEARPVSARWPG